MAATSGTGLPVLAVVLSGMGILVVAVVVGVLLLVPAVNPAPHPLLFYPPCIGNGCPGGAGNQPLATVLAISSPLEASTERGNWYNFSVQSAAGGLTWGDLAFQIQGPSGQIVSLFGGA
ncbi:MAG: hypothetical protein L3K06_02420, partial [Thermoplasmata archaeon]|nr:hypothetical protein [Thermoplasmata archaeon]